MGTAAGKAKVLGTMLGLCGATLLTFFKGVEINIWSFHHTSLLHPHNSHVAVFHSDSGRRLLGVLCAILSCFSYAFWLINQVINWQFSNYKIISLNYDQLLEFVIILLCHETQFISRIAVTQTIIQKNITYDVIRVSIYK